MATIHHQIFQDAKHLLFLFFFGTSIGMAQDLPKSPGKIKYPNGRNDAWEYIGIGGGGAMFYPAISPFNPDMAFLACDMGGGYVTYNGGLSWRMFNLSGQIHFYVFDPVDANTVYANATGLYKSKDRGNTWTMIYPAQDKIAAIICKGDHGEAMIVPKDSVDRKVLALAIDQANSNHLYAGISTDATNALYISEDGGANWRLDKKFDDDIKNIFIDPSSPRQKRTVFVTANHAIAIKKNNKWVINKVPVAMGLISDMSGGYDKKRKEFILYAISRIQEGKEAAVAAIYSTTDGGYKWQNRQAGLSKFSKDNTAAPELRTLATCAGNPAVVYVSYQNLQSIDNALYSGVAKSNDYGKTWNLAWKDVNKHGVMRPSENFSKDWLNDRFGASWGENPLSMVVAPNNPNLVLCTDFGRAIKSSNGGKTWEQVYSKQVNDTGWTSNGLEVTTGYTVVFDPFDKQHVFLANTDIGLLESKDGTKSWNSATKDRGIPDNWVNTCYWLAFDPEVKGKAWSVMSGVHDLPRPKMFRKNGVSGYSGGILLTENSGETWQTVSTGIGEAAFTFVLMDPASTKTSRTLYACAFGKGVYKSVDGGKNWIQKNKGLEGKEPFAWQITRRENDGVLFLIISRRSEDGSIGNDRDGALYRSDDGAENWVKVPLPAGTNGPTSLVIEKSFSNQLVLSAWGRKSPGKFNPDTGGGIFVSADDGKSWRAVLTKDQHISDITFDKRNNHYYACGFEGSAYFSTDGANNWNRIGGYNFKWGKRVDFDPLDPGKIFIITYGGGVWHGPSKGDALAREDVIQSIKIP